MTDNASATLRVLATIDRYDALACAAELQALARECPADTLTTEILGPLLHEAGSRWRRGDYTIAQEHMLSSAILRLLCAELDRHNRTHEPGARSIAFTTLSGDRHGMGALIAAVIAACHGVNALHLGADLPVEQLAVLARQVHLDVVALSIVAEPGVIDALSQVQALRADLPPHVEIWLGGVGSRAMDSTSLPSSTYLIGPLDQYLQRIDILKSRGDA